VLVEAKQIPPYILPGPLLVAKTLWTDGPSLLGSLWITLRVTLSALAAAILLGGTLAVLFAQSRLLERWRGRCIRHSRRRREIRLTLWRMNEPASTR